jgi:hypothetical protein
MEVRQSGDRARFAWLQWAGLYVASTGGDTIAQGTAWNVADQRVDKI